MNYRPLAAISLLPTFSAAAAGPAPKPMSMQVRLADVSGELELSAPSEHAAVANARRVREELLPGGWKKLTFARTDKLPSWSSL